MLDDVFKEKRYLWVPLSLRSQSTSHDSPFNFLCNEFSVHRHVHVEEALLISDKFHTQKLNNATC